MKKIATSIALAGVLLSSNVYANTDKRSEKEIRDEIQRLKMENELLELKNENERLQKGGSSSKTKGKNADVYNANVDKSGFLGFCKNQFANTGCYVGVEIGVADVELYRNVTALPLAMDGQKTTSIPLYLNFGYNHYYRENQSLRARAYIGYSSHSAESNKKYDEETQDGIKSIASFKDFESKAIHLGIEGGWGYDFMIGKHTLGASAGVGLNITSFFGQTMSLKSEVTSSTTQQTFTDIIEYDLDGYTKFNIAFSTALHYAYKNNHIITARYRVIGTGIDGNESSLGEFNVKVKHGTSYLSEYLVGYSYKF